GAFCIPFSQFGNLAPRDPADPPGMVDPSPAGPAAPAYRGTPPPDVGASAIRRGVLMAAHEGSEHADGAGQRGSGEATMEPISDHHPLMAQLRRCAAYAAYWNGHPEQSVSLARSGLEYLAEGQNAAQLHLSAGLASARLGDGEAARRAIADARDARERDHRD